MNIEISNGEQKLRQRKFYVRSVVILMVLLLFAFNIGSWLFHNKMESYLEAELSKRLSSMATIAAHNIETTPFLFTDDISLINELKPGEKYLIQSKLRELKTENELQAVYLIDPQMEILADASGNFPVGSKLTYLQQDSIHFYTPFSTGEVTVSPIHIIDGNRFKTAYAPITNIMAEVTALLVIEANADFFNIIRIFRRGLIVIGVTSFAAIILFSFFLSWTIGLLINTQESLRKTEKLAALGQMSASVAHEIRNPLGIIKATADVVKMKYEDKNQPDELFDFIGKEVMRLNNLVNDFLSFACEIKLQLKPGLISETVRKAVEAFERECENSEIELSFENNTKIPAFEFDREKIQQVLLNLLVNASQAIEGPGTISVELNRKQISGSAHAEIVITDTGCGIDGDVNRIFEPFFTTKSSGSGLGLAITKQIIEKHSGWIEVDSAVDRGTVMRVFLKVKS